MAITILAPAPAIPARAQTSRAQAHEYDSDSDDGGVDLEGDVDMASERPSKRAKTSASDVFIPGELVTDDPQWMRYAF